MVKRENTCIHNNSALVRHGRSVRGRFPRGTAAASDSRRKIGPSKKWSGVVLAPVGDGRGWVMCAYPGVGVAECRPDHAWAARDVTVGPSRQRSDLARRPALPSSAALLTHVSQWWPCPCPWSSCTLRLLSPSMPPSIRTHCLVESFFLILNYNHYFFFLLSHCFTTWSQLIFFFSKYSF